MAAFQSGADVESFPNDASDHIRNELEAQLFECAASPNRDVVAFFHMPVPHVPFIYDRNGRRLEIPDSDTPQDEAYLRNVEYVDAMLGRLMDTLKKSGQWKRTTLVVTGDHGIGDDDLPPLIVHLPGHQVGQVVRGDFYTTSLIDWLKRQPEFAGR